MNKTLKLALPLLIAGMAVSPSPAQTYYYDETKTFHENGFTYQCDNDGGIITLYNSQNRLTYADKTYKDGSRLPEDIYRGRVHAIEEEHWSRPRVRTIVNDAFSPAEKAIVKKWRFVISMLIDPDTGKVAEVIFYLPIKSPYTRIPPSTYYKIEQGLKKEICFTMTETGKQLNYALLSWEHEVK
ncbi:MAG: DUF5043 domain-containing protein [Odoribacteraceae bacterium]|jgi:hypothetical protein|nr:DUF5043 domain-containing protein [Odoribacteraceae bacterium]